jgi:hypothetical protein
MHHIYSAISNLSFSSELTIYKSQLGMIYKNDNNDIVWLHTGKPVELKANVLARQDWEQLQRHNTTLVVEGVMKGRTALVFLDKRRDKFCYYKGETKPGEKLKFYVSHDNTHWVPESSIPVQDIVYGVWYLVN